MSKRYTSGVVSSTSPTVNAAGASGVFTLNQQSAAQSTNNWPPYKIEKSLRFRNSASARLTRTPAVAGNKQIWTMSFWLKTSKSNFDYYLFESSTDGGNNERTVLAFNSGKLQFRHIDGGSAVLNLETSQLFRDPSAWYHIVLAVDTTQATSSNRVKMYLNGSQITAFGTSTYPNQNLNTDWNGATAHAFGASTYPDAYADGYFSEIYNIDGQALTPSSFGATDKDGNWSPIAYTGNYGTNGFYVNFKDSTSAATTGYDYSGNGNNWASSGISVTAGTTYDSMIDVPSDQSDGTANNRGNYATINPLDYNSTYLTLNDGNLHQTYAGVTAAAASRATMVIPTTGKYYWEVYINATGGGSGERIRVGITSPTTAISGNSIDNSATSYLQMSNGQKRTGTTDSTYGAGFSATQYIQVLYDATAGAIYFGQNNNFANGTGSFNQAFSTATAAFTGLSGEFMPCFITYGGADIAVNFGQQPFVYTPPTGFKALNTFNLPEPTIKQPNKHFDTTTYTGDGNSTKSITGVNFQPGFAWVKSRSNAQINVLGDVLRGMPNRTLRSDSTDTEQTFGGGNIQSLDSNGITVSYGSVGVNTNESGYTYVAWQWNAGTANTTNTSGSITSQVRANPTAGFSVVTYTGTGSNATVGHGLGVAPSMIFVKSRTNAYDWLVYNLNIGNTNKLYLNLTDGSITDSTAWNNTSPTSSTFSLGSNVGVNQSSSNYVAYCFAPVAGYSAFGSYTGNASTDGPFIYTGFRPRFVIFKRTTSADPWIIHDTARDIYNGYSVQLYPNASSAEGGPYSPPIIDEVSNGFKCRSSASGTNGSGDTIIYMAFAETPFKYARSR